MNQRQLLAALIAVICALIGILIMNSCKTIETVTEYRDREVVKLELQHDSIYMHDSVYVAQKGDTVYRDRWHTEYAYRYINRVDSFVQIDSIPYPVEVTKVVTKKTGFARFTIWLFWILAAAGAGFVGWRVFRRFYLHI